MLLALRRPPVGAVVGLVGWVVLGLFCTRPVLANGNIHEILLFEEVEDADKHQEIAHDELYHHKLVFREIQQFSVVNKTFLVEHQRKQQTWEHGDAQVVVDNEIPVKRCIHELVEILVVEQDVYWYCDFFTELLASLGRRVEEVDEIVEIDVAKDDEMVDELVETGTGVLASSNSFMRHAPKQMIRYSISSVSDNPWSLLRLMLGRLACHFLQLPKAMMYLPTEQLSFKSRYPNLLDSVNNEVMVFSAMRAELSSVDSASLGEFGIADNCKLTGPESEAPVGDFNNSSLVEMLSSMLCLRTSPWTVRR
ncbi:hypothetical protein OGAPHI_003720 [Ogataea philodendri]|uniref:Uncharacterized protein n=1 Tax=Ogataea philodendri TaxID=1378263 RepID=A0A9P8P6G2_9ASCO|nr:uncharacterized protein OGAPHI_003720 [Ogataea philodendri]KAH3665534.1 hypothetical protein OGAPHI_003720 [Ogataea philodendri]